MSTWWLPGSLLQPWPSSGMRLYHTLRERDLISGPTTGLSRRQGKAGALQLSRKTTWTG